MYRICSLEQSVCLQFSIWCFHRILLIDCVPLCLVCVPGVQLEGVQATVGKSWFTLLGNTEIGFGLSLLDNHGDGCLFLVKPRGSDSINAHKIKLSYTKRSVSVTKYHISLQIMS